jgi:hypothetical protein
MAELGAKVDLSTDVRLLRWKHGWWPGNRQNRCTGPAPNLHIDIVKSVKESLEGSMSPKEQAEVLKVIGKLTNTDMRYHMTS